MADQGEQGAGQRDLSSGQPVDAHTLFCIASNTKSFTATAIEMLADRFALDMGEGRLVPADMLSEGTVLALGLLTALRHPQCPRLILMDDMGYGDIASFNPKTKNKRRKLLRW